MKSATVLLIFGLAMPALAQSSAKSLSDTCQKAFSATVTKGSAKARWDERRPNDIYAAGQCEGFIEGWMDGIDGAILTKGSTAIVLQIKRAQITDSWDVANALVKHLQQVPLDGGKPADEVLRNILADNNLITVTPYIMPATGPGSEANVQSTSGSQ
jgi:hypothetical protein